jgi:hypothetical protein
MSKIKLSSNASGTGNVTVTSPATNTDRTITLPDGDGAMPLIKLETAKTATGTAVDFTGIPSWVKRITVMFNGVSTSGTSPMQIQIGAGSFTTSGYSGSSSGGTTGSATSNNSTGFLFTYVNVAATAYSGIASLHNITGNAWIESGVLGGATTGVFNTSGGTISIGGTLDRIRITTVNGTDTFDAGTINIMYEG